MLQLENDVAAYCGAENALAVNSATSALILVLHWFGVTRGDEVIVPAYTYCATAFAVMHIGATPVMDDCGPEFNIDAEIIKHAITPKTKAVITVDIGGWPCDYDAIKNVINDASNKFVPANDKQALLGRILLMADAAHSFGAIYNNRVTGTLADISVFSFHAVKNVTTAEGGIICLHLPQPFDNAEVYKTLRLWSLNGQTKDAFTKSKAGGWRYDIVYPGFKMTMPDVLAAIGLAQVRKYKSLLLKERRRVFDEYTSAFKAHPWAIIPIFEKPACASSYHLYPLRIDNITEQQRDNIIDIITSKGVAVNVHFIPMPLLTVFKNKGYNIQDYPQTYLLYSGEISLPVYPQLNNQQCKIVTDAVIEAVNTVLANEG